MNSLSAEEMEEEGLKEEAAGTDLRPDVGFRHNPAQVEWKPDLAKYNAELVRQLKKDLHRY